FGDHDVVAVIDMPDNVNAAAICLAVAASGLVQLKTTPLLTVEETDQALAKSVSYRAPGK
ncbi:MAG: GYD domain-containing protein, partial [Stellaceae bacterium]